MKTIVNYLFVFLFSWGGITGDTDCSELLKLPQLFGHYQTEYQSGNSTGIFSFLVDHYFDKHATNDIENHSDLPFHNHSDQQHSPFDTPCLIQQITLNTEKLYNTSKVAYLEIKKQHTVNAFFVPPKVM